MGEPVIEGYSAGYTFPYTYKEGYITLDITLLHALRYVAALALAYYVNYGRIN